MFGYWGKQHAKIQNQLNASETNLLYYKVGKDGVVANFQECMVKGVERA
jgi:hypothetical protein